jgi:putative ABC transport system permease protein
MKNFGFDQWAYKTALKEVRASWGSMFVLMGSLAIAIGSIVSVNSLRDNLNKQVDAESKSLLGADLSVGANAYLPDSLYLPEIEALVAVQDQAEEVAFGSMAYSPSNGLSRLSRIKAIKGNMPFYGEFDTEPLNALARFRNGEGILADPSLFIQLAIKPGDSLRLGRKTFEVLGSIGKLSGSSPSFSVLGPRIMMPYQSLEETQLVLPGSRVEYTTFYKFADSEKVIPAELDSLRRDLRKNLSEYRADIDTYLSQRRRVGRALDNIFNFLNLVGFGAIILGMIGVSVTINRFLKSKYNAIAVLRCLGATPERAKAVYWIQLLIFGFIGSMLGVLSGIILQYSLPLLAERITNSEIVFSFSYTAISLGLITGLTTSLIFAWAPLQALGAVSPLQAIREDSTGSMKIPLKSRVIANVLIAVLTFALAYALVNDIKLAIFAILGLVTAVGILAAIGKAMVMLAFKIRSGSLPYSIKQGLANLYRPNNQTLTTVVTVGTGVLIMGILVLSQQSLLSLLELDKQQDAANLVFLDIQNDQREDAIAVLNEFNLPVIQDVPIVTMRLSSINGKSTSYLREDSLYKGEKWALNREYRSSYRDSLANSELLVEGEWVEQWDFANQPVPVSAELGVMESLDISLGDTLTWDVQGVPLKSIVTAQERLIGNKYRLISL